MVGKTIQQYQFLEKLGAGGMGEIYKALDTRLNRTVAVKVLTRTGAGDPERRRRFIQEAQAASALNHPSIIIIHDILSDGEAEFMVMEHVHGKTLAELIPAGGMRVPQVLKLGLQMTDALSTAHAAGIIHRDLKPANIMVTDTGLVKVLDFGLAKLADPVPLTQAGPHGGPDDPTQTIANQPMTVEGSILGTVSYMSPEQAQGRKVDVRSDIFSLGVVLYEMVTGDRAFHGETAISTLSAILRDEARPIQEVAPDVPQPLQQLIWRCLRKAPDERFQSMKQVNTALGALKHESDSGILYRSALAGLSSGISAAPSAASSGAVLASADAAHSAAHSAAMAPSGMTQQAAAAAVQTRSRLPMIGGLAAVLAAAGGGWFWMRPAPTAPVSSEIAASAPAAGDAAGVLTNDSILQMWAAQVPLATIYGQMRAEATDFDMSTAEVIRLTVAKVPAQVIEAMRDPQHAPVLPLGAEPDKQTGRDPGVVRSQEPVQTAGRLPEPADRSSSNPAPAAPASLPPAVVTPFAGGRQVALLNGTPFTIRLMEDIPQNAEQGHPLHFVATSDVRVGDSVVIAKGASVVGEIAQGARRRILGGARMTLRLLTVEGVDGRKYSVRALASRGGDGKAERRVETNVKPKSEDLEASAGTEYVAYADGDLQITVRK